MGKKLQAGSDFKFMKTQIIPGGFQKWKLSTASFIILDVYFMPKILKAAPLPFPLPYPRCIYF